MKTKLSFFSVVFCCTLLAFAIISIHDHSYGYQWSKTFGGAGSDSGASVQQTDDGGFIITGSTVSFVLGGHDVYLIKTDGSGNELWSKAFGGADHDGGESVQQTDDGGFIITGDTRSFGAGSYDVYLIKTDASGNELWSNTFGGASSDGGESVQQTDDGGFIIAGGTGSFGAGETDVYLIKTDGSGNELWSKTFGGADHDGGASVQQTDDGGFIIVGATRSFGDVLQVVYLIKTDASGNELWSNTFGGASQQYGSSVQQTADGGFIIVGGQTGYAYLIKTDASGNELWSKTFGGAHSGSSVQQTDDGGFIIVGDTRFGAEDLDYVHLIKTDGSGDEIWSKTFGGASDDHGASVQQTDDGGFIITGWTESFGDSSGDVYLIYFKPTEVCIDIMPRTCPNECLIKGGGSVEVAILGTVDFDVNDIDIASVRLEGIAPVRSSLKDKSTPVVDPQNICDCTTDKKDGFLDLCLKFNKKEIISALGEITIDQEYVLTLSGVLNDDTPIEGKDCIIFVKKGKKD